VTGATAFKKATASGEINQCARQVFLSLYPNRHKSILKPSGCRGWVTLSRHVTLADETILNASSLQDDTIWGCRWGEQTRFAVLDIDEESKYHNELGLARLRHLLASVGFDHPQNYQSSESGGWHLYLSFSDWVACETVQKALKQWLMAEGYEIKPGQLELFPSNNGLRLPLQRGFAWLDDQGAVKLRREQITTEQALVSFVDALGANAHDWVHVQKRITRRLEQIEAAAAATLPADEIHNEDIEEDGFSAFFSYAGMIQEVYDFGRNCWLNGLTAPSQRHHAIICIGHYLWYGDESEGVRALPGVGRADQRAAAIEDWLQAKHNGFSKSVLRGDWKEIGADIRRACSWESRGAVERQRESYSLTDRAIDRLVGLTKQTGRAWCPEDFQKGNVGREETAREKIRGALLQLVDSGRRVSVRGLERLSGCKRETIRRHADIWSAFRLSNGLGDLSFRGGTSGVLPVGSEEDHADFHTSFLPAVALTRDAGALNAFLDLNLSCSTPAPVVPFIRSVPDPVVAHRKESFLSSCVFGDSGDLGSGISVQGDWHKESPPLLCLARSLPPNPQHQDQALRVPSAVLTPGPWFDGIQAEGQEGAGGGILSMSFPAVLARSSKRRAAVNRSEAEPSPHEKIVKLAWRERSLYRAVRQDTVRRHAPTRAPPVGVLWSSTMTKPARYF